MLGISDIFKIIEVGKALNRSIRALRTHMDARRSEALLEYVPTSRIESLDRRTADIESAVKLQSARISELETDLQDSLAAAETLAESLKTVLVIAATGGAMAIVAIVISIVAIVHAH